MNRLGSWSLLAGSLAHVVKCRSKSDKREEKEMSVFHVYALRKQQCYSNQNLYVYIFVISTVLQNNKRNQRRRK
jgi:hypothetical protein